MRLAEACACFSTVYPDRFEAPFVMERFFLRKFRMFLNRSPLVNPVSFFIVWFSIDHLWIARLLTVAFPGK